MKRLFRAASLAALALASWLSLTPRPPQLSGLPENSDKLAHFAMHFGLAFLLSLGWRMEIARPVALGAALALEIGQLLSPGRTASLWDLVANLLGMGAGLILGAQAARRWAAREG